MSELFDVFIVSCAEDSTQQATEFRQKLHEAHSLAQILIASVLRGGGSDLVDSMTNCHSNDGPCACTHKTASMTLTLYWPCDRRAYLDFVHETAPIPLAQQPPHKGLAVKVLKLIHVLTCTAQM